MLVEEAPGVIGILEAQMGMNIAMLSYGSNDNNSREKLTAYEGKLW